ncbi:uncharacterized protein LOC130628792 [Hydractinia symbiolongicarpus]|uniref:uncharacterized protein LOC130628792 n=1 Tax=Hydractinia symbiolongicarpus TaxID=13093 RepID=UPI00254C075C|nr:uncharacterized protein LOC130628792 [Hydractinia symbiolongicarpus]
MTTCLFKLICILAVLTPLTVQNRRPNSHTQSRKYLHEKDEIANDEKKQKEELTENGLPDLMSLFGTKTATGTQYKLFGCTLDVDKEQCKIKFVPQDETCQEKLSISRLFNFVFKKKKLQNITGSYLPLQNFQIEHFLVDKCEGDIEFRAVAKETFDIVREKLKVKKAKLEMSFNYKKLSESFSFDNIGIDMKGEILVINKLVPIALNKKRGSPEGKFSAKIDEITASDFGALFTKKEIVEDDAPENTSMLTDAVIKSPSITGSRDVNGSFEIVVKGQVDGIKGLGPITLFVIVQKFQSEPTAVAIVADVKQISPTKLLSSLTGKKLNDIPIIKYITVNVAIEFANNDMMLLKDAELNKLLAKYIANAKTVAKGTKIKLDIPVKKILKEVNSAASLKHVPDSMYVQVFIHEGKICFKFPDNATMDLLNIAVALIPAIPDVVFNKILKSSPKVLIKKFDVNVATKEVDLLLVAPEQVVLGEDLIKLKTAEFELKHIPDGPWNFRVKAEQQIGEAILHILVQKKGENYEFNGKIADLSSKELIKQFGGEDMDASLLSKLEFLDFGIRDLQVNAKFGDKLKLHAKGNPILFGWEDIHFEGFIFDTEKKTDAVSKSQQRQDIEDGVLEEKAKETAKPEAIIPEKSKYERKMAFGIVMKNIRLDDIVLKLFNKTILRRNWLSNLRASFTISNTKATKEIDFTYSELKNVLKVRKGIYFTTELTIPEDCKGDALCEVAREKMLPGTKLYLEGDVNTWGMELRAGYRGGGLQLGDNIVLHKAHIVIKIAVVTEVYIEGELKIKDPPLIFKGKLAVGVTGRVELTLSMLGMWKRPFGLKFVAFGNIEASVGILPTVPVPKLGLSAEVHVGKIGSGNEIKVKSAIGFHPGNPLDNFFYAEIKRITLSELFSAFGFNLALPKAVLDSGFPEGLVVAFSTNPRGKEIKHLNQKIGMGFLLRGKVKILGIELGCNVHVNFPREIKVAADMSPIKIGKGLIKLQRSKKDGENGPKLYVIVSLKEVAVRIQGYVQVLSIAAEASIDISNKGIFLYIYGNLFNLIEANVTISAPYGNGEISESQFMVGACLSTTIADITLKSKNIVTHAAESTEEAISKTTKEAEKADTWYDAAHGKLEKWSAAMEEKQAAVQRKSNKLEVIEDVLDDDCVDKCDDVCLGGPTVIEDCGTKFGITYPCVEWDDCKTMVEDPVCLAKCAGDEIYLEGKAMKKKVTIQILISAIEVIQKILELAKGFVERSKVLIDTTEKAASQVEKAAAAGKKAMYAIAKYTKENLIDIHHICFNTTLEKAESACFGISVNVTLGGRKNVVLDTDACLDVSFVKNIGSAITEELFPGIQDIKTRLDKAKDYFEKAKERKEDLKEYSKESEEKEKELEGRIQEVEEEDEEEEKDEEVLKKESIHKFDRRSRSMAYIRRQAYTDLPPVLIHDDLTMDAFDTRSPWAFSQNDSPFTSRRNSIRVQNKTQVSHSLKETVPLDFDSLEDPEDEDDCIKSKKVMGVYSTIAETVGLFADKFKEEKEKYLLEASRYVKRINNVERGFLEKCRQSNVSEDRINDAMLFMHKTRNGTAKWMRTVDGQLRQQDEQLLKMWRKTFNEIVKANKNIDMKTFMESLQKVSTKLAKRHSIPRKSNAVNNKMAAVSQITRDLLSGPYAPLSSKLASIDQLQRDVGILRKAMGASCAAA